MSIKMEGDDEHKDGGLCIEGCVWRVVYGGLCIEGCV